MWFLVARLVTVAWAAARSRALVVPTAGAAIADFINLDFLNQEAFKAAPDSDPAALREAAAMAARMLGLGGDDILPPNPNRWGQIAPSHFVLDLRRGRAWYLNRYQGSRSRFRQRARGFRGGWRSGRRDLAQTAQTVR